MKKGDLELGEIVVVLLLLVGVMAGSMYLGAMEETLPNQDNRTMGEILVQGRLELDDAFYSEIEDGDFRIRTHEWMIGEKTDAPDTVPLGQEKRLISEILFDDTYVESIRGFTFKVYTPTSTINEEKHTRIKAFAVFLDEETIFDDHFANSTKFNFDYFPYPVSRKDVENCEVVSSNTYMTENETVFKTYFFDCTFIWYR